MKNAFPALALIILFAVSFSTPAQKGSKKNPVENNVQFPSLPPDLPVEGPNADFPLHVHLNTARWGGDRATYRGYGSGNILDANATKGFDYSFDCAVPFRPSKAADDFYLARWTRQSYRFEILMHPAANDRQDTCELRIVLKPQPYDPNEALAFNRSPLKMTPRWQAPEVVDSKPDAAYPLQVHIITASFGKQDHYNTRGLGIANLIGTPTRGLNFTYTCNPGFLPNTQHGDFYQGRWVKQDERIEILTQETGGDQIHRCQIDVTAAPSSF